MTNHSRNPAKEIEDALSLELAATPKQFVYVVESTSRVADVVPVKVDLETSKNHGLAEELEGASAWWPGPPRGFAEVLSVDPEREQINLRFVTPQPPAVGDKLFVYPPMFLEALRDWWQNSINAQAGLKWLWRANEANRQDQAMGLPAHHFPWLRTAQQEAFQLPTWDCGFLEGPPGTGKTTTLGALLATYLVTHPTHRVLLLSTTNTAVDLALVAVDKALERMADAGRAARKRCKQLGHHFVARHYTGRDHLLPAPDPALIRELADLESRRPDPTDLVAYAAWKRQVDAVRAKLKSNIAAILRESRLAASTTCAATFWTAALHECAPFDLVVFDEASQVGLAYAMALATFGKRTIFAGDPAQLAPVVRSEHRQPREWLGRSAFDRITTSSAGTPGPAVFLDEQSRMHSDICGLVSRSFYRGRLKVAKDAESDPAWHAKRRLSARNPELNRQVFAVPVPASHTFSQKYRGPIRYDSAHTTLKLVTEILKSEEPESVLVLTPFRAQRALLRSMLRQDCKGVSVSTVHKAQGSERRTIVFDPVDGNSTFLLGDEARRLVNVALSRAEARLVILLSEADRQNPLFSDRCFDLPNPPPTSRGTNSQSRTTSPSFTKQPIPGRRPGFEPVESYLKRSDFPRCLRGLKIRYKDFAGTVTEASGEKFTMESPEGEIRTYRADFVRAMFPRR